jgi:hypothetical protein
VAKIVMADVTAPTFPIVAAGQTFADIRTVPTLAMGRRVAVVPVGGSVTPVMTSAIGATLAIVAGLAVLLSAREAIRQTTLVGAWWWTLAALLSWAGVELWWSLSGIGSECFPLLQFAAVAISLCPAIAVLGAKRPQHSAWNLVVLSLWMIAALPAAEACFLQRVGGIKIGDLRSMFLWALILLGPTCYLLTRYWLAALVLCAGQIIALGTHLVFIRRAVVSQPELVGLFLAAAALVVAWFIPRRQASGSGYDGAWLDFRDTFGLFWALRVQERVNAAAKQFNWDIELGWRGFRRASDGVRLTELDSSIEPALRSTFKGLLRRFVSNEWIDRRLR